MLDTWMGTCDICEQHSREFEWCGREDNCSMIFATCEQHTDPSVSKIDHLAGCPHEDEEE